MSEYLVKPIGEIETKDGNTILKVDETFIPALKGLDGFSHINIFWWFHELDDEESRKKLEVPKPYKKAPQTLGTFATRSPQRPNPIALSTSQIISIDHEKGIIHLSYIDADNGSPVLDLKPYTPSLDRVENPKTPSWCSHWPKNTEESGDFPWEEEFLF